MTRNDAIRAFISYTRIDFGGFGDYWSMQAEWAAYVDSLERDGEITERQAFVWDNPTTPKGFRRWHLRHFGCYPETVGNN